MRPIPAVSVVLCGAMCFFHIGKVAAAATADEPAAIFVKSEDQASTPGSVHAMLPEADATETGSPAWEHFLAYLDKMEPVVNPVQAASSTADGFDDVQGSRADEPVSIYDPSLALGVNGDWLLPPASADSPASSASIQTPAEEIASLEADAKRLESLLFPITLSPEEQMFYTQHADEILAQLPAYENQLPVQGADEDVSVPYSSTSDAEFDEQLKILDALIAAGAAREGVSPKMIYSPEEEKTEEELLAPTTKPTETKVPSRKYRAIKPHPSAETAPSSPASASTADEVPKTKTIPSRKRLSSVSSNGAPQRKVRSSTAAALRRSMTEPQTVEVV